MFLLSGKQPKKDLSVKRLTLIKKLIGIALVAKEEAEVLLLPI
jgi:hypothetical protein